MRIDDAPAYYQDRGCAIADSCLKCPLSVCVEDIQGDARKAYRYLQIRTFAEGKDISLEDVAQEFGVTRKTVLIAFRPEARAILSWRVIDDREEL
jgi:AraC-like DNA-binding protein